MKDYMKKIIAIIAVIIVVIACCNACNSVSVANKFEASKEKIAEESALSEKQTEIVDIIKLTCREAVEAEGIEVEDDYISIGTGNEWYYHILTEDGMQTKHFLLGNRIPYIEDPEFLSIFSVVVTDVNNDLYEPTITVSIKV